MAASAACGFRPSLVDGGGAFAVRRAAGEENRRSGTARSAPGASGTLHPSNCPGGQHGLRLQAVIGGRTRSLCRASRGRGRESSQWNRPERAGRGWYVKRCAASVQLPGRRARLAASGRPQWTDAKLFREPRSRKSEGYARRCFASPAHPSSCPCGRNPRRGARLAASGRHQWTDAEPYRASRSRERESSQWNCPERAGREWYAASVQLPGRRVQLQAVLNGRTRRLSVSRAAGKVRDTRDGVLRLRHIRPVARAGGIHGGERGLRLQTVVNGRTRSFYRASRGRESGTTFYTSGTSVQSPVRAESAAAASTACSFRPSSMDGRGAFPCATQSRKE